MSFSEAHDEWNLLIQMMKILRSDSTLAGLVGGSTYIHPGYPPEKQDHYPLVYIIRAAEGEADETLDREARLRYPVMQFAAQSTKSWKQCTQILSRVDLLMLGDNLDSTAFWTADFLGGSPYMYDETRKIRELWNRYRVMLEVVG